MTSIWLKDPTNDEKTAKAIFAKNYDNVSAIYYLDTATGSIDTGWRVAMPVRRLWKRRTTI